VICVWISAAALALLTTYQAGAGASGPPYSAGMTWNYRHTVIKPGSPPQTGVATNVYRGPMTLEGKIYHVIDQSSTIGPGVVERTYLVWTGSHFRQAANVATDARRNAVAIIFDKPFGLLVEERASGIARIVQNTKPQGTIPWSFTATSRGKANVTVPGGSYETTRWAVVLKLGKLQTFLDIYSVGVTDIRQDSKEYVEGSLTATVSRELVSGPVR
jgi:hypothetical protein